MEETNTITQPQDTPIQEPVVQMQSPAPEKNKSNGIFIILALLVLAGGLIYFLYTMTGNNQAYQDVPVADELQINDPLPAMTEETEKTPSEMTDDELYNDLEINVDAEMQELDQELDSLESGMNEIAQ